MSDDITDGSLASRLLVATPRLGDPNFSRAVILVLEHNEDGALGVVLNRPSTASLTETLPSWRDTVSEPAVVFVGGPVQQTAALGLGWCPTGVPGEGLHILGDVVGTVDLDAPDDVPSGSLGVRIFAGYAGWGHDQLTAEIETGSWYVVDAVPGDAFTAEPERLWRTVLRRQPGELAFVSLYPDDPTLN